MINMPTKNWDISFITKDGAKHEGWHSGTRWHSKKQPYTKGSQPDFVVASWEYIPTIKSMS